jgi:hypothetical protein
MSAAAAAAAGCQVWTAADFSDGEVKQEMLCIRFGNAESKRRGEERRRLESVGDGFRLDRWLSGAGYAVDAEANAFKEAYLAAQAKLPRGTGNADDESDDGEVCTFAFLPRASREPHSGTDPSYPSAPRSLAKWLDVWHWSSGGQQTEQTDSRPGPREGKCLSGLTGVSTRPAGYPTRGVPTAAVRQLHLLTPPSAGSLG